MEDTQGERSWYISSTFDPVPVCWHKDYAQSDYTLVIPLHEVTEPWEDEWYTDGEGMYKTYKECLMRCQTLEWKHITDHYQHIRELQGESRAT